MEKNLLKKLNDYAVRKNLLIEEYTKLLSRVEDILAFMDSAKLDLKRVSEEYEKKKNKIKEEIRLNQTTCKHEITRELQEDIYEYATLCDICNLEMNNNPGGYDG